MGTTLATLLRAEPHTTWGKTMLSRAMSNRSIQPGLARTSFVPSSVAAGVAFPASRGVLILTYPEQAGSIEVN